VSLDQSLSIAYIDEFPQDVARVLEQLTVQDVAELLNQLPSSKITPVLIAMMPKNSAACLAAMSPLLAADVIVKMPLTKAIRIYRHFSNECQKRLSEHLPDRNHRQLKRLSNYSSASIGELMTLDVKMFPADTTVVDTIRAISRMQQMRDSEIYIVDDQHRLVGAVELGKLLTSNQQAHLGELMNHSVPMLSAHAPAEALLTHPAWQQWRKMPVVERDNTLVGLLEYTVLYEIYSDKTISSPDSTDRIVSLGVTYWLSLVHLFETFLSMAISNKQNKS